MGNLRSKYSDEEWEALVKQSKIAGKELKNSLTIPDIRNKLSPITNMIALFERGEYTYIKNKGLDEVKKSINYLCDREVYKL